MPHPIRVLIPLLVLLGIPASAFSQSSTLTGATRSMNPAISVNHFMIPGDLAERLGIETR